MDERTIGRIKANTWWPLLLTVVLVMTHLVFPSKVWVVLLWMMGGLGGLGYYWARQMQQRISIDRRLRHGWVQVGDRLEEQFEMTNNSWLPVLWAEVIDESDLPGYEVGRVSSCPAFGSARWSTAKVCTRRGIFTLGPWSLRVSDPFGFFSVSFQKQETEAIAVYPPVVDLPQIQLPRGLAVGQSRALRRISEATIDVSQTRYYQPNDPWRLIHWPSTAHRGELIVREFDAEISGDLWVVLDLDQRVQAGEGEESTEEYGVILSASLADRTLRQNRAVGLLAFGEEQSLLPPGRGKGHMWRILHNLAEVKAGGTQRLSEVLHGMRDMLGQGTTVLVITPSCEPDWIDALLPLTRHGIAPSVVLLDAQSFADGETSTLSTEVQHMQNLLANAEIHTHIIQKGYPFRYVTPPQKRGFWEFKVSPLGRAILVRRPEEA
jgi:uncharacterized protein (DUF58 family)